MVRQCVLLVCGVLLLVLCVASLSKWLGVWIIDDDLERTGRIVRRHERWTGIENGIFYNTTLRGPLGGVRLIAPVVTTQRTVKWFQFNPMDINVFFQTTLGFSFRPFALFRMYIGHGPTAGGQWSFPLWPIGVLLCIPAIRRLFQFRRQHRLTQQTLCPTCGYDLRATPDRCPECGTPVPTPIPSVSRLN